MEYYRKHFRSAKQISTFLKSTHEKDHSFRESIQVSAKRSYRIWSWRRRIGLLREQMQLEIIINKLIKVNVKEFVVILGIIKIIVIILFGERFLFLGVIPMERSRDRVDEFCGG